MVPGRPVAPVATTSIPNDFTGYLMRILSVRRTMGPSMRVCCEADAEDL